VLFRSLEAGLGFAVKLNKKDFIGKEALLKQKEIGLTRKLCCMTLSDSQTIALGKEPVRSKDGQIIGWVAAGGFGYSVEKSIIYAYLPIEYAKAGTELEVEFLGEQVGAVVVQSPLWDPIRVTAQPRPRPARPRIRPPVACQP
jgi:dimethylglycine oxidase